MFKKSTIGLVFGMGILVVACAEDPASEPVGSGSSAQSACGFTWPMPQDRIPLYDPIEECLESVTGASGKSCVRAWACARELQDVCRGHAGDPNGCIKAQFQRAIDALKANLANAGTDLARREAELLCKMFDCSSGPTIGYQRNWSSFHQDVRCPIPTKVAKHNRIVYDYLSSNGELRGPSGTYLDIPVFEQAPPADACGSFPLALTASRDPQDINDGWQRCDDNKVEYRVEYMPKCSVQLTSDGQQFVGACVAPTTSNPLPSNALFTGTPADLMASARLAVRLKGNAMLPSANASIAFDADARLADPRAFSVPTVSQDGKQLDQSVAQTLHFVSRPGVGLQTISGFDATLKQIACSEVANQRWPTR